MNDTAQQTEPSSTTELPTMQDIAKKVFAPEAMEKAQAHLSEVIAICNRQNVSPIFNFNVEEDFPAGYSLAIIPLSERVAERGNVTKGVCVAAIPTIAAIMQHDSGEAFVTKQILDILVRQVSSSAKAKDGITSLPFKVGDFTTSSRSSGLASFNALSSVYVQALKKKGLKFMSKLLLRQTLQSSAFAEQQFPRIDQDNWDMVLQSMIAHAAKDGLDAGNLAQWKKTRSTVEVDMADVDLTDLDDLI